MATTYLREDEVFGTKPAPQYLSEDEVFGKPVAEAAPAPVAPTRPTVTPVTLPSAPVAEPLSLSPEEPQVVTEAERAPVVEPIAAARPTPRPARPARPARVPQAGAGRGFINPPLIGQPQPEYTRPQVLPEARKEPIEAVAPSGLSGEFAAAAEAIAGELPQAPQPKKGFYADLPTEDKYVVNPAFIDAVQKQLDVMPEDQRKDALDKLAKRTDVYGRAARVIQGRYERLDTIKSPTIKDYFDPRLEAQTDRYIKQGARADVAESIAKQRGQTVGIGRDLQQLTRDIAGEQAASEEARITEEMKDAGFATRVGAEVTSRLRQSALGAARIYADVIEDEDLQRDLGQYARIERARGEAIPKGESIAAKSAQQAIATLTQQAPMLVLGALTGTALPVLGQAAFDSFTQSYNDARSAGKTPGEAATRAGMMATSEMFFERYGLSDQFKAIRGVVDRIPAEKLSGYLASAFIKEIPAEQATTLTQFLTDKLPQIGLNPNAGLQGYLEQAGETLRQTVLQSGAQSAIVYGAGAAARRLGKPEEPTRPRVEPTGPDVTLPTEERLEPAGELPQAGPTAEIPLGEEISVPGRPEPTLTFEPMAEVPGRIEPTLEGVPLAPTLRSRGAQPERLAPEEVETVPGMPTADVLAEEPRVTPVTPAPVSLEPIEPSAVMPPETVTPVTPAAEAPEAAPGNQPRIGDAFDPTGWTEQENKINKKTGQPSLTEGRVRYKRTDDRGFEQTVIVQNGQVSTSNSVSPVIELTNSSLDFDAPVKGRIIVLNSDVQGIVLTFVPEDSSGATATGMSPRAVQQYKAGVPIEKIAETEFSDAGGIMPDGTRTPHTTVGRLVAAPKKTVTPVTPPATVEYGGQQYNDTPRIRSLIERATEIESGLPPAEDGYTRLWRGNRPGEVGKATSFTNSLVGIALPFQESYGGDLSYIDVPTSKLEEYESKGAVAPGAEFSVPTAVAAQAKTVTPVTPEAEAPAPPPAVTPVTPKKVAKPKVEAVELPQAVQELDEPVREQFQKLVELARLYDFKPGGQEPNWNLAVKSYKDTLATRGEQGVVDLFANTERRIRDEGGRAVVDKANQAYADKFGGLFPTPPVLKNAVKTGAFDISDQPWANAYYDLAGIDPTKIVKAEEPKDAVAEHVARFNAGQYRISTSTNIKGQTVKMSEESYVPAVRQFLEGPLTAKPPTGKQDGLDFDAIRQLSDVDPMPVEIKGKPGTAKDYLGYIKALYALTPKDDVRYYLKGVYLDPKTDRLAVTDGHRLVIVNNAGSKGKVPERPAKGVTSTDDIILGPDGQWGKIGDNLISGKFPNIDKVTPKAEDQTAPVTFNTEEFLGKARAVEKGDKYFKTKYPLALAVQVENRQFSFNPQYLADMAEVFRKMGYETFSVSLPKGKGALLATSPDGKVQQVVMPMREGDDDGKIVPMFWKPLGSKAAAPKVEKPAQPPKVAEVLGEIEAAKTEAAGNPEWVAALDRLASDLTKKAVTPKQARDGIKRLAIRFEEAPEEVKKKPEPKVAKQKVEEAVEEEIQPLESKDPNVIGVLPNGETKVYKAQGGFKPGDKVTWQPANRKGLSEGTIVRIQDAIGAKGYSALVTDTKGKQSFVDIKDLRNLGEDVVNSEEPSPDLPADRRLVLMPCCDMKGPQKAPAMDLYKGVFFQTFRANVQAGGTPKVVILSAKHGFVLPTEEIEPYDQLMTPERADEMVTKLAAEMRRVDWPKDIDDVLIVGGKDYQKVMRAAVLELQKSGEIAKDATVNATAGGIGEQRKQLGEYLRSLPAAEKPEKAVKKERLRKPPKPVGEATEEQVKEEAKYVEQTVHKALEEIQKDFMVGDLVRFGNTPGVVIGLEGDYVRFRPDSARSPKAYQRVPKKSLTRVSRPDTTSEVSYSKAHDNKFGEEAGQFNADKANLIRLLGANMYQSALADVAIKELLQNAFDAVKGATSSVNAEGQKITPLYKSGTIEITINAQDRTISFKDDARGMTPDIVRKAFFTIAGSEKSDLPPEMRSGGLGLAKMGFMLGSERLQLDTVRDGVRVTVDAAASDIATDNFKIVKAPAPKGEHGTTVTVKIPETYIDPKTGDPKSIFFPYSMRSIEAFNKPLIGPVEVKATFTNFGKPETVVLPVGVNFPADKFTKFKANFEWGSADIYFSIDRNTGSTWDIKHQVLSSGVYQFSPDFTLNNEKIPFDIIVDVKPNVDARHPDYPFENSRERFKGRLDKDVQALTMYLGQIARGYEARDLQDSFKGVVSMPRVEVGTEIAGMAEKLKKTFGSQAAATPTELKPLPKEVTVTADTVRDTKTQQVLVDVKAKEAEKQKEATFKGEAVPKGLDFMIEMKQDPKLPVFHNNTNLDYMEIGKPYGEPEKFFAELGTLVVEMKEELAKSGMFGYDKLSPENLFFAGVSIDKGYGGVHIKVPYKAIFINPFYSFGARTLFGARQQLLNTMIHEIAHTGSMDHGVAHNTNMVKVEQYLADEGMLDYYRDALLDILRRHESVFTAMREAYGKSTTRNTAKSLEDYGKDAAAASSRGDRGRVEYAPSALSARGRPEGGAGIPEAKAAGRKGEISGRPGETRGVEEAVQPSFEFDTEITDQVANANPVVAQALSKADELPKAKKKLPPGRSPELAAAAEQVLKGTMTKEEFDGLVNRYKPIPVYAEPLMPATSEQVYNSLDVLKREKINPQISTGYPVGLRLDIPAFNRHGVFVVTIHEKRTPSSPGEAIGYTSVASIKNVKFGVGNQKATLQIAAGKAKDAIQTMEGEYVPITPEEAYRRAKDVFDGWVQVGIDPTRHAYFYDRRTTQPVLAADEVIQIGNMILARGVTYGFKADFLFNIDSGPGDIKLDRDEIRRQQIQNYANLRSKLTRAVKKVAEGEMDISMQRNLSETMQAVRDLQAEIKATKPRRDSAERFMARALQEYDDGNISADVLAVIQSAYNKSPELLEGLLLSVKTDKARPFTSGSFEALRRVITLYKGTSGITNPSTIRHELTHALEQMMTPEQASVVVQAWAKALQRAINQNPDELHQRYFNAVLNFIENPNERTARLARKALPSYEMYQFINPSEFWAVNGEPLMASELGGAWDKFKKAVRKLFEGLKNVFGFDNRYAVHKIFDQIMKGDKKRMSHMTLIDFVSTAEGPPFTTLENIDEDQDLMKKYNRPHTPMLDTNPLKTFITRQFKNGKEFFQSAVENPKATMSGAGDSLVDGLIYLRNKNVWYGSGLESRDFDKYNGELKTSEGMSTASVALDNAIRSGNIGVEVIFRGGIKFDSKSNNFVAVEREKGMKGVYEAEAAIKKRLGDQLGTDIVQGYLEAKRSISIMNELYEREADLEAAKENLAALKKSGADPGLIEEAEAIKDKATKDLDSINKAVSSVNMSEEEMEEFAALDQRHPELRDLMNNWTAVNQNLLRFWRQVGLLSEARYESLSSIKDYVPWYRIMNDELDLHDSDQSAVQSTTRSMTNIGVEKLFKRGKPISVVDFRAEEGQKDFKIQPSSVVKVKVNGKVVNPDLISVTPSGDVRIDMDLRANDFVVFETNREIQNIIDNMTRNVMRMTMNGIRQYAANRIVLEYATRNDKGKIAVYPSVDVKEGRFNWVVDGKKVVVEISDPLVAASIYGMENLNLQMWRPLAALANLTRRSITLSGVFQVKQVFKDAPTAAIVTGVKNPLALIGGVWKGFLTSLIQPAVKKAGVDVEPVVEILKAAGIGGYMSPARTPEAEIKRRLGIMNRNVFSAVIKGLDHIGDASDMAQRVATYKRVLAETGNETQALYQAANVINFLHHGSAGYAQAAVKVVPFLGAYANATDVLFRSLMGSGLKGVDRKKALARLAVTGTMLASLTILYAMLASTDPDYDELDDDTKLKNIIIPGTKIMLPMNTSAALFFKAIPELIYNKVTREGTENEYDARRLRTALGRVARDMLLGPEPIPAGVKPVLEVAINYNFFTGRTVIPEGLKDVAAAEQYTATTSELGKKISEMMSIPGTDDKRVLSPIEADHLVRGIFGTAGAMAQWVSNSLGTLAETRPEPTARETPITGSFLRDEIPRGREDLFYDFKDVVFEKYKTWKKMVDREDYEAADAYIEKHGDVAAMYEYINETEAELKEINTEIRRLGETRSKDQSPRERREEIDELKRVKQDILEPVKELRREVLK